MEDHSKSEHDDSAATHVLIRQSDYRRTAEEEERHAQAVRDAADRLAPRPAPRRVKTHRVTDVVIR